MEWLWLKWGFWELGGPPGFKPWLLHVLALQLEQVNLSVSQFLRWQNGVREPTSKGYKRSSQDTQNMGSVLWIRIIFKRAFLWSVYENDSPGYCTQTSHLHRYSSHTRMRVTGTTSPPVIVSGMMTFLLVLSRTQCPPCSKESWQDGWYQPGDQKETGFLTPSFS